MTHIMSEMVKTRLMYRGKSADVLLNYRENTNEQKRAAITVLSNITSAVYWATPKLMPLVIFRNAQLSIKYGLTELSAYALATYGLVLGGLFGWIKDAYELAQVAIRLIDRFNAKEWHAYTYAAIYCVNIHFNEHIDNTLKHLRDGFLFGLETGSIEYAGINANHYVIHSYLSGKKLKWAEVEARAYSEWMLQFRQFTNHHNNEAYRLGMLNFMGLSDDPLVLKSEDYDEAKLIAQKKKQNDNTGLFRITFSKLILATFFFDESAALLVDQCREALIGVPSEFEVPNFHFYESIVALTSDTKTSGIADKHVKKNVKLLKKWSKYAPENYQHKLDLVLAELLKRNGNQSEARLSYDRAIKGASKNGFLHEEALSRELAGKFYLEMGSPEIAEFYIASALNSYREWGAEAKAENLIKQYPQFLSGVTRTRNATISLNRTNQNVYTTLANPQLDLTSLLKASTTISGEIQLQRLLETMLQIVMENAGAQKSILILESKGELLIQAESDIDKSKTKVLQGEPLTGSKSAPVSIIKYVRRTSESLVVHDATADDRFNSDPYVTRFNCQSILCVPIINQGRSLGVLYLENNLSTGTFTQDRVELLLLLSGQIAVSIQNALLYNNVELLVKERTAELVEEKQKYESLLLNILPTQIANELKENNDVEPRSYESVTVMFTDFKDFTRISDTMSAQVLVGEIRTCYSAFDDIIGKYRLEKIKTIGDSYMCAGGLPVANSTHPVDTVRAALEIQHWMNRYKKERESRNLPFFECKIGLHTGPVVAGVVGTRKFAYDIWGQTVNVASRMESSSLPGKVNISATTYELIKDKYECTPRGKLPIKNHDDVDMYFVESLKRR